MANPTTLEFTESIASTVVLSNGTTDTEVNKFVHSVVDSAPITLVNAGKDAFTLGASATNTINIYPQAVASIASGNALEFMVKAIYGSTDTTLSQKEIEIQIGATPDTLKHVGGVSRFTLTTAQNVVLERINTANETVRVEVLWWLYTV